MSFLDLGELGYLGVAIPVKGAVQTKPSGVTQQGSLGTHVWLGHRVVGGLCRQGGWIREMEALRAGDGELKRDVQQRSNWVRVAL